MLLRRLACLSVFAIAGCTSVDLDPAATERAGCASQYPLVKGSFTANANCLTSVDQRYTKATDPSADLIATMDKNRASLAADVDAGQITPADYTAQLQQLQNQIDTEKKRRTTENLHSAWGISHGLDSSGKMDANPLPVIPPG